MADIIIFAGHFGSGKTETALNYAFAKGEGTTIVDLDIVNPFFRTYDAKEKLQQNGIKVIAPTFANTNLDIPALPSDIYGVFESDNSVIFDVGGDDEGAMALGRFFPYFKNHSHELFIVINIFRPLTQTVEEITEMIASIEGASRLRATGLINASNLMELTTVAHIQEGEKVVRAVSDQTGIPFVASVARRDLANQCGSGVMPLDLYLSLPFDREL